MTEGLGPFIRSRRTELGLTQERVADAAAIGRSHLSQIESGKIGLPNAKIRRRLAQTLRVRHVDLLVAAGELSADEVHMASTPVPSEIEELTLRMAPDARAAVQVVVRHLADAANHNGNENGKT
ncbi:MAG: helix-turn-helix transcriptional regulator [Thermomicrobiales bacterium]|nr:helix-turn-helix transcriptional regulator [Thermomicrobiales bacterium]